MKLYHILWVALPVLCGCNGEAPEQPTDAKTSAQTEAIEKLSWLDSADPNRDALVAIAEKDFRLMAVSGRGLTIPGVQAQDAESAKQQCNIRYMPGMGDVIMSPEHQKWRRRAMDYAKQYNALMAEHCMR